MATERRRGRAALALLLIAGLLAACAGAPVKEPPPPEKPTTPATPPAPGTTAKPQVRAPEGFPSSVYESRSDRSTKVYRISTMESEADIYVYRSGKLARFGHNHIITSRDIFGYIMLGKDAGSSRLDLYFPVDTLSVDEPELRAAAGDDFSSQPSPNDIAGTRKNMLGERMLNAAQFPYVIISAKWNGGTQEAPELDVTVTVRGITHTVHAAAHVEHDGELLRATGELPLSHAELGLEPFTALGGALSVRDDFTVHYKITARPL
jgi:hypothetical protein